MKKPDMKDPKLSEFVGILLGDGSIGVYDCKRQKGTSTQHKVQISCNSADDYEYLYYIKPELVYLLTSTVGLKLSPKWDRAAIPSKYLNRSLGKRILRGCFDTDGSLVLTDNNGTLYPRLEMKISPSPMQKQIIDLLTDLEFNFGSYDIGKGKVRIQMNGNLELSK